MQPMNRSEEFNSLIFELTQLRENSSIVWDAKDDAILAGLHEIVNFGPFFLETIHKNQSDDFDQQRNQLVNLRIMSNLNDQYAREPLVNPYPKAYFDLLFKAKKLITKYWPKNNRDNHTGIFEDPVSFEPLVVGEVVVDASNFEIMSKDSLNKLLAANRPARNLVNKHYDRRELNDLRDQRLIVPGQPLPHIEVARQRPLPTSYFARKAKKFAEAVGSFLIFYISISFPLSALPDFGLLVIFGSSIAAGYLDYRREPTFYNFLRSFAEVFYANSVVIGFISFVYPILIPTLVNVSMISPASAMNLYSSLASLQVGILASILTVAAYNESTSYRGLLATYANIPFRFMDAFVLTLTAVGKSLDYLVEAGHLLGTGVNSLAHSAVRLAHSLIDSLSRWGGYFSPRTVINALPLEESRSSYANNYACVMPLVPKPVEHKRLEEFVAHKSDGFFQRTTVPALVSECKESEVKSRYTP